MIGLADVGSGGALKRPWSLLPAAHVKKFNFEPIGVNDADLPLCLSNHVGKTQFFIAHDERASSFHQPSTAFAERFGQQSLYRKQTIEVECTTLDRCFGGSYVDIDTIDINVEGHDYQVLQGGADLMRSGVIKLLKIEFEVVAVWEGQGWLSDIDSFLRSNGYTLAGINFDYSRPVVVRHCFHRGEPLWGKAIYVPGVERWSAMLDRLRSESSTLERAVAKAVALYLVADVPGYAFDILDLGAQIGGLSVLEPARIKALIGSAYRWAKIEHGARELTQLTTRALGLKIAVNET